MTALEPLSIRSECSEQWGSGWLESSVQEPGSVVSWTAAVLETSEPGQLQALSCQGGSRLKRSLGLGMWSWLWPNLV